MRANVYAGHDRFRFKHDDRNRGPSSGTFDNAPPRRAEQPSPAPVRNVATSSPERPQQDALAATLAMHEALAQNWVSLNQYCSGVLCLARPFYTLPFDLMQQYLSFIFGCPQQWASEPVAQKRIGQHEPQPQPPDGNALMSDGRHDCRCAVTERAMDAAIGASTEMWFEMIQIDTPLRTQPRRALSAVA